MVPMGLSLLALATSASAECAWGLWSGAHDFKTREVDSATFNPLAAYESLGQCEQAATEISQSVLRTWDSRVAHPEAWTAPFPYSVCFPAATDPRPRGWSWPWSRP